MVKKYSFTQIYSIYQIYITHFVLVSQVKILGRVTAGLHSPELPGLENGGDYIVDSFLLAIISFAVTISMVKMFSRKHAYSIDQNQVRIFSFSHTFFYFVTLEIFATDSSSLVNSCFTCFMLCPWR